MFFGRFIQYSRILSKRMCTSETKLSLYIQQYTQYGFREFSSKGDLITEKINRCLKDFGEFQTVSLNL